MSLWTEIVNTAVIGYARKPLSLTGMTGELGGLLARLDQNDREGALLGAAAPVWQYEQAAALPMKDTRPLPEACEPDDTPRCSERAAAYLAMILREDYSELLPEWVAKAAAAGRRAPEELLPELLEFGRKRWREPREILPALGVRVRWLAAQNPAWAYASDRLDETMWEPKSIEEQPGFFHLLRKRDAARARELLESIWDELSPKARYAFLSNFGGGLSLDDEAFLERALDDGRYGGRIRAMAAQTLARLPDSALRRRMFDRARPLLKFKIDELNRKTIEVMLPEERNKAMRRDGLDLEDYSDPRKKADCLGQMLMSIPPRLWSQEAGWTATELIEAANQSEWKNVLIDGWVMAAARSHDAEWAGALFGETYVKERKWEGRYQLFNVLPPAQRQSLAIEELKSRLSLLPNELPYDLIFLCDTPWGEALSRLVIDWSLQIDWSLHKPETLPHDRMWNGFFFVRRVPYLLDPALIPEAISRITEATNPPAQRAPKAERLLNNIQARYEMLNAF
jgi:hypothetical protein